MAILKKCWCGTSVRKGSFFSGFYTLGLYTVLVATGLFHVNLDSQSKVVMILSLLMVMFAGLCIVTSTLLLVGLCVDCGVLLLPWIVSVSMTTFLDAILSFFLLSETETESMLIVLFTADILICALNVYCVLCVISHYQAMAAGQGSSRSGIQAPSAPDRMLGVAANFESGGLANPTGASSHNATNQSKYPKFKCMYRHMGVSLEDLSEKPSSVESEDLVSKEERSTFCDMENLSLQCRPTDSASAHSEVASRPHSTVENRDLAYVSMAETCDDHPLLSEQYSLPSSIQSQTQQCDTVVSLDRLSDSVLHHVTQLCKIPTSATCPSILLSSSDSDMSPVHSCKLVDSE